MKSKEKGVGLHPRNIHQGRYDLAALEATLPELREIIFDNDYGQQSIDFANPIAVKLLNKALLLHYYGVSYWDIPVGYLCPPIPGRADYLHHVADLLARDQGRKIPFGEGVHILDLGVGANLIYPILAKSNDGTNLGGAIFLISPKRIHYVCAGPTQAGKEIGIMHGIINHVALQFPNHEIDFEGSSIPSVAQFYKKFGPINEPFYIIQRTLLSNL